MQLNIFNKITNILIKDNRFNLIGNHLWATRTNFEDIGEFIFLKKHLAGKGYGSFEIQLFQENEQGVEIKIKMYVPSYCEWNTFFEGFVENENDFIRLMVMLGLN